MREFSTLTSLRNGIWITVLAVAVLTLSGPFGTFDSLNLGNRLWFWTVSMVAGTMFIQVSVILALKIRPSTMRGVYGAAIIGTLLGSVPATAVIMIIFENFTGSELYNSDFPLLWSNVALVGCIVSCGHVFAQLGSNRNENAAPRESTKTEVLEIQHVPLLSRLPNGVRPCQIVSFSMQDHYVEVTTMEGQTLLLMRLTDAINELGELKGARSHRSHWVSERHLVDIKKDGRKSVAVLTDGRKIPISAPYLDGVRAVLEEKNAAN